jgi:hypothetical protein
MVTPSSDTSSRTGRRIVVLDANVLLHFKRLDDPSWEAHLQTSSCLVVPPATVAELDKHKRSMTLRLQRRARNIIPWLEQMAGEMLHRDIELRLRAVEPHRMLARHPELDGSQPDDRIVATALELVEENPGAEVIILTDDTALRLKARNQNLVGLLPAETLRLPEERTREEQDRDDALRSLETYEHRQPKLILVAAEDPARLRLGPPTSSRDPERVRRLSCWAHLPLRLKNAGGMHAEHIRVEVSWSGGPVFRRFFADPPMAVAHERTEGPVWVKQDITAVNFSTNLHHRDPRGPNGADRSTKFTYDVERVVHDTSVGLDGPWFAFDSLAEAKGFTLEWVITAVHQVRTSQGRIDVQVETNRTYAELRQAVWEDM